MRSLLLHLMRAQRGLACVLRSGLGAFGQVFGLNSQLSPVACLAPIRPIIAPPVFPVHPLSIRLVPGPPRSGHFVYGGDQTYEQALPARDRYSGGVRTTALGRVILPRRTRRADEPSTARIHRWARRCGGCLAARGARAAARHAGAGRRSPTPQCSLQSAVALLTVKRASTP